mmetsp:Transcript_14843/g.20722  ORF Transcript_14843/g.20722 Transcript_14843/m.20722 type:complete len:269 (-) Transcript_14843:70-876(-)
MASMDTQFLEAAKKNDLNRVKELLDAGTDVNLSDYDSGNSALHLACANGAKQTMELLVERGANVNAQNSQMKTPLHMLISKRYDQMAFWLVKRGANLHLADRRGETPRDLALPFLQKELDDAAAGKQTPLEQEAKEREQKREKEQQLAQTQKQYTPPAREEVMKVYLSNDSYKSVMIKGQMNTTELAAIMAEKLNMDKSYGNHLDIYEIQKDTMRKLNSGESVIEVRSKWPTIFGKTGNETHLHCKLLCKPKSVAPQDVLTKYTAALK